MPVEPGVALAIGRAIATIKFDRPERRNALGLQTWRALPALIAAAEANAAVRLIILRGAGGHFGAGNDIAEFGALRGDPVGALSFARAMADGMAAIEAATKPVIVAIEGHCYGASVAVTLAGDLRVAADDAAFAITPAKLGALYLQSDLHRLTAAIGAGQSTRMIYTAQAIDAARALQIGLVDEVIPAAQFEAGLESLIRAILQGAPFTLRRTKAMLRVDPPAETDESLAAFVAATQWDDFAEGIAAFLSKRRPCFVDGRSFLI